MRVIRAAEGRRTPWKNGGGETVEIIVHPADAGLDGFDWRVSRARVAAGGPFSAFPGVDRTLAVLSGDGLELSVGGAPPVRLDADAPPFAFPGDAPCAARLLGGPVEDFNVMTRRGRYSHALRRIALTAPERVGAEGRTVLVFCAAGAVAVDGTALAAGDAAVSDAPVTVAPAGAVATVLVATIGPA